MNGREVLRHRRAEKHEQDRREAYELAATFGARIVRFGAGWRIVGPSCDLIAVMHAAIVGEDFANDDDVRELMYGHRAPAE